MTATITPPAGVPALQRVDPVERLADYERALSFYVGIPDAVVNRVVFAENSGADLGPLRAIADRLGGGKEVELVSFDGLDYPVAHGRAVGEMRLIETALSRSRLLAALDDDEPFWKVTGRLRFTNLASLVATAPEGAGLYVDFRRHPRPWVDTRVFASTPRAFRELLLPRVELLRQDELERAGFSAPEERLFGELLPERERGRIVPRLRYEPRIEGYSGQGEDYARPARRAWTGTRAIVRRLCPPLWI
ncbi:MAG TPA: hypothetical protein VF072_05840 [Thermoleophilaceae bacterium]